MANSDARVLALAQRQKHVVTRRQALALGMTDRIMAQRVATKVWSRLSPGVFLTSGNPTPSARLAGAVIALPAVVSHESAARIHDLTGVPNTTEPTVTITHRFSNRFPLVTVHESTDLSDDQFNRTKGLPVTNVSRTIFDLADALEPKMLQRMIDDAFVKRIVTRADLSTTLGQLGRRGRPGTARFRSLVESFDEDYVAPESELERLLISLLERGSFPLPQRQADLPWRTSVPGRVDIAFPEELLIIECDGRRWHTLEESFERDRRRDNLAQLEGWRVLRFTWEDVTTRAANTTRKIRSMLRATAA